MNPVYESMTRDYVAGLNIRVWRQHPTLEDAELHKKRDEIHDCASDIAGSHDYQTGPLPKRALAEGLAKVPGVVAVEVVDDFGNGIIYYPDWN